MRGKKAKMLRRMAEDMGAANVPAYVVKRYTTNKRGTRKVTSATIYNNPQSIRGVYRNLKKGA